MKKLQEAINDILRNPDKWNYYHDCQLCGLIETVDDIKNPEKCYAFIKRYIYASKKYSNFSNDAIDALKSKDERRLCHIVSSFFFGLALYYHESQIFSKAINRELAQLHVFGEDDDIEHEFMFVWFMVCMFHDLGYIFENKITSENISRIYLYNEGEREENTVSRLKGNEAIGLSAYKEIISNYSEYRERKDHGITGGLNFVEEVSKLRKLREEDGPQWKEELQTLYEYVGWRICCHNMWFVREGNSKAEEYREAGLSPLVLSNEKKGDHYEYYPIGFKEEPLFFFFCLEDSIEPMKVCSKMITNLNFDIEVEDGKDVLKISSSENCRNYNNKVKDLDGWLTRVKEEDTFWVCLGTHED